MENSSMNTTVVSGYAAACMAEAAAADQFPAGLSVLVVDDDKNLLKILEQMLRRCSYNVTICSQATVALNLLRERKGYFDVILSDVHMPDMDGFKLLEVVGLEMDLPVIMMSADHRTSIVMEGIRHGACDYLIKPIREEELKNLWQHVVRKKWNGNKEHGHSGSLEDSDWHKRGSDDAEYTSVNDGTEGKLKAHKKRSISKDEDDGEFENDDSSSSKKPRVVWSVELHQQFVVAVNHLGIDKAVPKRILELMNVPGLTRENVASHLQKFRLYLKRLSGVAQQQGGIPNSFYGPMDPNVKISSSLGKFDIRALAASGQIHPQTLAALHAELLDQPTSSLLLPTMDQPALLQESLQGSKCIPVEHGVAFGHPLVKCQSSIFKHFPQSIVSYEDASSGFGSWPSNGIGPMGPSGKVGELNTKTSNIWMDLMQRQQQESVLPESSCSINVQPSCLVVPSRSSASFQMASSSSFNQNSNFSKSSIIDYSLISSQPNNSPLTIQQASDGDFKGTGMLNGYSGSSSISPSVSSCSVHTGNDNNQQVRNSTITYTAARQLPQAVRNVCKVQGSYGAKSGEVLDRGQRKNIEFIGKGICIPSRFAVDELESLTSNLNHGNVYAESDGYNVKEEPNPDFTYANFGLPVLERFTPNVFSE